MWIAIAVIGLLAAFYLIQANRGTKVNLAEKIENGAFIVDVRSPMEYQSGHFEGAVNIPVDQVQQRLSEFGPVEQPIIVYCASGARSGTAQRMLTAAGYTDVHNGGGLMHMMQYQK